MSTQTTNDKTENPSPGFDLQSVVERVLDANIKAGNDYLNLCEKGVEQFLALELEVADAAKLPAVSTLAKAHVDVTRKVAGTYVDTARQLLKV